MPRIFTIFNHGTDFHRDKAPGEVVTQLHDAVEGAEAQLTHVGPGPTDWRLANRDPSHLICEGPGSEEIDEEHSSSGQRHAHPGKYNPLFNTEKGGTSTSLGHTPKGRKKFGLFGKRKESGFQKSFSGDTSQPWQASGRALGRGWDDNVYKATFMITHLQGQGKRPDVINLVGWSRGAVTCLKMANKIYEVYKDTIELNIFAIDPVPGGLTSITDDIITIPPNVRNYLAVLALDDDRVNFQPTDRETLKLEIPGNKRLRMPNIHFLPLPGNHSDVVSAGKTKEAEPSGILCAHLAWKFLGAHGTTFAAGPSKKFNLPASVVTQTYGILSRNLESIAKTATSGLVTVVGGRRKERHVRAHRETYVRGSDFFVNEHHRQCALMPGVQPQRQNSDVTYQMIAKDGTLPIADLFQMGITYDRL